MNVLIAEDEEALRGFSARALSMDGHEVMTACDGGEALEVLAREQGRFDLLLTDIRMPIMDGIALSLAAARDHPDLTILLMTGYADQPERADGVGLLGLEPAGEVGEALAAQQLVGAADGTGGLGRQDQLALDLVGGLAEHRRELRRDAGRVAGALLGVILAAGVLGPTILLTLAFR